MPPASPSLAEAARRAGWSVHAWGGGPPESAGERVVYYGGTDVAVRISARLRLALIEPPLDLLARLPSSLLHRGVEFEIIRTVLNRTHQ